MSSKRVIATLESDDWSKYDPGIHDPASVDNLPIEVPLEWKEPPSLQEEIRRYIKIEMSRSAAEQGFETFEEANDLEFSDDDDFDGSANELTEDQEMAMLHVARSSRDTGGEHGNVDSRANGGGGGKGGVGNVGEGDGAKAQRDRADKSVGSGVSGGGGVSAEGEGVGGVSKK